MSRFGNLEFGEAKPPSKNGSKAEARGTPTRDAVYFLEQAGKQHLAGDYEAALRNYSRSLEQNPAQFDGWFGQVRMLIELGEYEEALLWANKALELFPEHPDLLASKAVSSLRTGDVEQAMAYTDNALSKKGATPYVWLARAEALFERRSATAAHCLNNAMALAGDSAPRVNLEAGRLLLRAGEWAEALDRLRKAAQALPDAALAWFELGRCQAALGFPEAEATLSQCLKLRPDWRTPRRALERFQRRGLLARLREVFRRPHGG